MEFPKLVWLKRNIENWSDIDLAFDLADFITFKLTGSTDRSVCTLVCKWGWIPDQAAVSSSDVIKGDWEQELLEKFDLKELRHLTRGTVLAPGAPIGKGVLCEGYAASLGIQAGTAVAAGLIDAHAGALGILETRTEAEISVKNRIGIIAGTSSCHMILTDQPTLVPGVWGPYQHAIRKGTYLLEGGQTSAGSTLDWIVKVTGRNFEDFESKVKSNLDISHLIVIPDFHGNRSPISNPSIRGSVHGIGLETSAEQLYAAAIEGLAFGTRHIMDRIEKYTKTKIDGMVITGGLSKSHLFNQINSNVCSIPVIIPKSDNGVLLGSAMIAAVAAGKYPNLKDAQMKMSSKGQLIKPEMGDVNYEAKFETFIQKLNQSI